MEKHRLVEWSKSTEHELIDLVLPRRGRFVAQNRVEMKVAPLRLEARCGIEFGLRIISLIVRRVQMMIAVGRNDMPYRPDAIQGRANPVVEMYRGMHE